MGHERWMQRCLELAQRARGRTAPNPMVGAVIIRDGELLGEGWHPAPGQPHAEIHALAEAGDCRGATLYVNLEPCCHHGRTPPCTDAILAAGIPRVVVGMQDPHPVVAGGGFRVLRDAGVEVIQGVLEQASRDLNGGYIKAIEQGLPQVWLKAGATLDGKVADHRGQSKWITGEEARAEGHQYRNDLDAILVGSGTVMADDPALTCRIEGGRDPIPVVLDSRLRTPRSARFLQSSREALIYCAEDAPARQLSAEIVRAPRAGRGLDLSWILRDLVQRRGVHDLLVEGGPQIHRSMLEGQLADRLLLFMAPRILAGGRDFVEGPARDLGAAFGGRILGTRQLGEDLCVEMSLGGEHVHRTG